MRIDYEEQLTDITNTIPEVRAKPLDIYPNGYLSRVLVDNYSDMLRFSSLYFNLSLCSRVTKYLVELIYELQCWEIYHLLLMIPHFDYILNLVDIEVHHTPFGHIVRPPANLMKFNLRQGFQYPFPYPFYNFSYHVLDPTDHTRKFGAVKLEPYQDIKIRKPGWEKRKTKKIFKAALDEDKSSGNRKRLSKKPKGVKTEPVVPPAPERNTRVYIVVNTTRKHIEADWREVLHRYGDDETETDYTTDEADKIDKETLKNGLLVNGGFDMFLSPQCRNFVRSKSGYYAKSGSFHQCLITDNGQRLPCLKIFDGRQNLYLHQEGAHEAVKKLLYCVYCKRSSRRIQWYSSNEPLSRHLRRKHGVSGYVNKKAVQWANDNADVLSTLGAGQGPLATSLNKHITPQEFVQAYPEVTIKLPPVLQHQQQQQQQQQQQTSQHVPVLGAAPSIGHSNIPGFYTGNEFEGMLPNYGIGPSFNQQGGSRGNYVPPRDANGS